MSLLVKGLAEEILLYLPQMQSDDADETILLQGKVDDGRTKRGGRRDGVTISMRAALPFVPTRLVCVRATPIWKILSSAETFSLKLAKTLFAYSW